MASFDQYSDKFETVNMIRRDGILQMTFHTNGGPLQWGEAPTPGASRGVPGRGQRPGKQGGDHDRHG